MFPLRLLIVDDHVFFRRSLCLLCAAEGSFVIAGEGANGREAVALVPQLRPDVVLMDTEMPEMDGITATRQLLAMPSCPPIILLTTHYSLEECRRVQAAGAWGYLTKDMPTVTLIKAIRSVSSGNRWFHPQA